MEAGDARIERHGNLPRQSLRRDEQRAATARKPENLSAVTLEREAEVRHRHPDDLLIRQGRDLLEGEVGPDRDVEDGQCDIRAGDLEERPGDQIHGHRCATHAERFPHRHVRVVDLHPERAREAHARDVLDGNRGAELPRQPFRRDEERTSAVGHSHVIHFTVAQCERQVGHRDPDNRTTRVAHDLGGGRLLKREVAAQTLAEHLQHDALTTDLDIRAGRQIQHHHPVAEHERLADGGGRVVDGQTEGAGETDSGNIQRHLPTHGSSNTIGGNQQRPLAAGHDDKVRSPVAQTQLNIRRDYLHRGLVIRRAQRPVRSCCGCALESEIAPQALGTNRQLNVHPFHAQVRTRRELQCDRVATDLEAGVDGGGRVVDCQREGSSEHHAGNIQRNGPGHFASQPRVRDQERPRPAGETHVVGRAIA